MLRTLRLGAEVATTDMGADAGGADSLDSVQFGRQVARAYHNAVVEPGGLTRRFLTLC